MQSPNRARRSRPEKWRRVLNLRKKPDKPALGRGRLQRQLARAFAGGSVRSSTELLDWAYARRRVGDRKSLPRGLYWSVRRVLMTLAEPIGRAKTMGRPTIWRLRQRDIGAT
jgi:hypothetical protein